MQKARDTSCPEGCWISGATLVEWRAVALFIWWAPPLNMAQTKTIAQDSIGALKGQRMSYQQRVEARESGSQLVLRSEGSRHSFHVSNWGEPLIGVISF